MKSILEQSGQLIVLYFSLRQFASPKFMMATWGQKFQRPYSKSFKESPVAASPSPPLGKLIQTLRADDLEDEAREFKDLVQIYNARTIASYNWVDKALSGPAILTPGRRRQLTHCET